MTRLIYSEQSLDDFDQILERIAKDNHQAAVRLGEDLIRTCELFESHPLLGQALEELAPGIRRLTCRGYAVYYRVEAGGEVVRIVRLLPPRRNVTPDLFR